MHIRLFQFKYNKKITFSGDYIQLIIRTTLTLIMIIFTQKRDRRHRKIIYNKKNLVPNLKPARPKGPIWGTKWLVQEIISAVVHDMKKDYS